MALGLYKAGQGYWVRVLTATMAGIVVLAGCAWLWNELDKASGIIPRPTWTVTMVAPVTGTPEPGQAVSLMGEAAAGGVAPEIGKAVVKASDVSATGGELTIKQITMTAGHDPSQVKSIVGTAGAAPVAGNVTAPRANPLFEPLYLQAAGVAVLMTLGAILT